MSDASNFQRIGEDHNTGVGQRFEDDARSFFKKNQGIDLIKNFLVPVGVSTRKKEHRFDLGSSAPAVLVECKSHRWTSGGNMPSAKMTVWNEAMYYFHTAPEEYRKIMFVLKHHRLRATLASYYLRTHGHMVPDGVEMWEFDTDTKAAERLR